MRVTWQSKDFDNVPKGFIKTYVRYTIDGAFQFCDVDLREPKFNIRTGEFDEAELTPEVVTEARKRRGTWPSYVRVNP